MLGTVVNVLIVTTALALLGLLGTRWVRPAPARYPSLDRLGAKAPDTMLDWKKNGRTLLVIVGPACPECQAHARFFQSLISDAPLRAVAVFMVAEPPPERAHQLMAELGLDAPRLLLFRLARVQLHDVPALVLVDSAGTVTGVWKSPIDEAAVLAELR